MLYVAKCRHCGFIVSSSDAIAVKQLMAGHLNKSHSGDYDLVATIPLNDFKDDFIFDRVKDKETAQLLMSVMKNRGFWIAIRKNPELQSLFSGLSSGEFKPFLKSTGKLAKGVSFHTKGE